MFPSLTMSTARNESAKLEVGSELEFRVIRLNPRERKIALSQKEPAVAAGPAEIEKPKEPVRKSTMAEALSSAGITRWSTRLHPRQSIRSPRDLFSRLSTRKGCIPGHFAPGVKHDQSRTD